MTLICYLNSSLLVLYVFLIEIWKLKDENDGFILLCIPLPLKQIFVNIPASNLSDYITRCRTVSVL